MNPHLAVPLVAEHPFPHDVLQPRPFLDRDDAAADEGDRLVPEAPRLEEFLRLDVAHRRLNSRHLTRATKGAVSTGGATAPLSSVSGAASIAAAATASADRYTPANASAAATTGFSAAGGGTSIAATATAFAAATTADDAVAAALIAAALAAAVAAAAFPTAVGGAGAGA